MKKTGQCQIIKRKRPFRAAVTQIPVSTSVSVLRGDSGTQREADLVRKSYRDCRALVQTCHLLNKNHTRIPKMNYECLKAWFPSLKTLFSSDFRLYDILES